MKFLSGHLGYALGDEHLRRNVAGLLKYIAFLLAVITVYSVLFHVIMEQAEGQQHSWITGFYWTLTVMTTLGFGDITFASDLGRAFSVLVLISGVVLLLIVLPFAFIRYFYAPWLEARLRVRAPRAVAEDVRDHVIICAWDDVARALSVRLDTEGVPWTVLEEDGPTATEMVLDGIPAVRGPVDDVETYVGVGAARARLVVLNRDDLTNANIALTIREVAPDVPLTALVEDAHSVDVLELGGCNQVLALKRRLGEQLANRVNAGHTQAHVIGRYRDLLIAEFSTHETPLAGKTLAEAGFRGIAGVNVVGVWDRGAMHPPRPDLPLTAKSLPVITGSQDAIDRLNEFLYIYDTNWNPVVIIGGGKVGRAAARNLRERQIPVHMVEKNPDLAARIGDLPELLVMGDAANREIMREVGVDTAPSILLTTNQDATNIYLASYCRRLNPEAHIVSRITHGRNVKSVHRAGADLTLSYTELATETLLGMLHGRPPVVLGAGLGFHKLPCPRSLEGRSLGEAGIGRRVGLTVVGVERPAGDIDTEPGPETVLEKGAVLLAMASRQQVNAFHEAYGG